MHVIATAGHVDHGKSSLVHKLTGIDPDRLKEEKQRGLTIDLGFAWLNLPSGREVGIVDVPGHERFIKNMLAGVGAINVTLFVVAANEGWKPQSQEHLDILDLLGISSSVVALTKADTVGAHELDSLKEEVAERLEKTTLSGAQVIPTSVTDGRGLEALVGELDRLLSETPPAEDLGRPRLWVDRVFTMKGSGTVVTGTLTTGSLQQQQEVEIVSTGGRARIRSIQSHKKQLASLLPGNRCALNLSGTDVSDIQRGDVVGLPGTWRPTQSAIVRVRFLPQLGHDPAERGAFKFYVGSAERDCGMRFLTSAPKPGETALARVNFSLPVVLDWKDRFVIRDAGRRETLGGGLVAEPHPKKSSGKTGLLQSAHSKVSAPDRLAYLALIVAEEGFVSRSDVPARTGLSSRQQPADLAASVIALPSLLISASKFEEVAGELEKAIRRFQVEHPLEVGMPREAARQPTKLDLRSFDEIVAELENRGRLASAGTFLHTPDHAPSVGGPEMEALLSELESAGSSPPSTEELGRRYDPSMLRALVRSGDLTQVSADLLYTTSWLEDLKSRIRKRIDTAGPITVANLRDLIGASRKYAVPLAEYLDSIGFTQRKGDLRSLGPKA